MSDPRKFDPDGKERSEKIIINLDRDMHRDIQ